ncbi:MULTISPECIES: hypothetical protein [Chryseobacterium]|uniref:Restriction endonuclease n=1 Tax=Chryseobacterium camelliae TaxID=1265445 RepID=A0ABU0TLA4_9FLAO|nr:MULTISPECIES: hypothetical protein [Chryseobacterium]MDT3408569.1 hypothetical protein [Pseudacidovorax intermedius]MDQ1097576.1 hypothetical protein [Chryseobacterium camelliae]MDQ1101505.1 hypothetical protein [Chryseobacterium sp. SORGH_AS_1048]MDR6084948.1 hypothetical protein [Chryseobacterium sp. SORGH_AS_0909]MDR6129301.1 hypothetical protein [Chryseobacterium sp. SORGH_AS_1175]
MEENFKNYEKTITKKHSISFTPKYKEEFNTPVNEIIFIAVAEKAFEKLGWDVIYKDNFNIEAKRKEAGWMNERWTEIITTTYKNGNISVKSESLGNEIWDAGKNSKRVQLFIYAYQETLKTFDQEALKELEKEAEKKNNWDDYIIPDTLPKPMQTKTPDFTIPLIGGLLVSLILGFIVAFLSVKGLYFIGLFEFLVATTLVFAMKYFIKYSNYTNFRKLQYLLAAMVILIYSSNQYFQYEIILHENNLERIGFLSFLQIRFSQGFVVNKINLGWIGWIISWIIQLGLTGLFTYLKTAVVLTKYVLERIPAEVVDFACYHFVKNKSEEEVRKELAGKGWSDKKNQDEVFEAIGGVQNAVELNRIK